MKKPKPVKTPGQLISKIDRLPMRRAMPPTIRKGSMDILAAPSRIGSALVYPDGRFVK